MKQNLLVQFNSFNAKFGLSQQHSLAVDLNYFILWESRQSWYLNERSWDEEFESGIIIVTQVHQHHLCCDWPSKG